MKKKQNQSQEGLQNAKATIEEEDGKKFQTRIVPGIRSCP